ncbi:MAG: DUF488 family protein [Nitrososphaerota archaeon]|jgi:uncharacterized protein YeaO (DUF488 family)|nr:DUF488 family protein [Nitrososphaerota archaeon]MDG6916897.1 DUF488 family protein [Nitrososphaerota archaeon]MDG6919020.1 DUF488 family protein [Nitrososphaerota archaeon]
MIKVQKSIYDEAEPSDGKRILVMRIWPRGISKGKVDVWMKDLGTPKELIRRWKDGKVSWDGFAAEYKESLKGKEALLRGLASESRKGTITLLCTERDPAICHRSLLKDAIERISRAE